jgi:hypothetical protein
VIGTCNATPAGRAEVASFLGSYRPGGSLTSCTLALCTQSPLPLTLVTHQSRMQKPYRSQPKALEPLGGRCVRGLES